MRNLLNRCQQMQQEKTAAAAAGARGVYTRACVRAHVHLHSCS